MATVPYKSTPTVQLQTGSPVQFTGTNVQAMEDVVTDDTQRFAKSQLQAAEIGYAIQKEKDDAKAKEMFNIYSRQENEEVANYLSLEGGNAVKKVGETDDGKPIYAYDNSVGNISSLKENIASTAENNTQRDIFNLKAESSIVSATDKMTRHSLKEQNKYADTEDLLNLDTIAQKTASSVDDYLLPALVGGNYQQGMIALDIEIDAYAKKKGYEMFDEEEGTVDSQQYIALKNKVYGIVHDNAIKEFTTKGNYHEAQDYLNSHKKNNTISIADSIKHQATIKTGLDQTNGETLAKEIIDYKGNPNSGGEEATGFVLTLPSSNNGTHQWGLPYDADNTRIKSIEKLQILQKNSKVIKNLPTEFHATHLLLTSKIGVEKTDSVFNKANKILKEEGLVIDKERLKTDPAYAEEINNKRINKVLELGKETIAKEFADNSNFVNLINKDLDYTVSKIDYTYKDNQESYIGSNEETDVNSLEDSLRHIRETIIDNPKLLEYAEASLKDKHSELEKFEKANYAEILLEAEKFAFAKEGGWIDIPPDLMTQIKPDDFTRLKKGFPKIDDINTIIDIEKGEINITDENKANYQSLESLRHLMTESTYKEYALEIAGGGSGSGSSSGSYTIDTTMFDKNLQQYQIETKVNLLKDKNDEQVLGNDYLDIKYALKNKILEFEKENKAKPNYQQKEALLQELLTDRVFTRGLGSKFGYGNKPVPISAINTNQMKRIFVKVGGKRIFMKDIPKSQELLIIDELNKANIPVTQYKIAEYWVKAGKPKTDSLVETTQGIGEIKGSTYGLMGG